MLAARLDRARDRLGAQRLTPALIHQRIGGERERLEALRRIIASLDPDRVLERGYVRVTAADGRTLVSKADAGREASLSLHFRDGALAVAPVTGRPSRSSPKPPPPEQGKLL